MEPFCGGQVLVTMKLILAIFALSSLTFAQGTLECDRLRYCEMRDQTTSATGRFEVTGLHNGSITVHGENRRDVAVRIRVEANSRNSDNARDVLRRIRTFTEPGRFRVEGPENNFSGWFFDGGWSVSVEILVPRKTDLILDTHNGAIRAEQIDGRVRATSHNGAIRLFDVVGDVDFNSHNGGVKMSGIGGNVRGSGHNGGIELELSSSFVGRSLQVDTSNGAVTIGVPRNFNGHVSADTNNGSVTTDFPINVRGRIDRHGPREFDLGNGASGATLRITTRNGGIRLRQLS
jgi:hypothetical protein